MHCLSGTSRTLIIVYTLELLRHVINCRTLLGSRAIKFSWKPDFHVRSFFLKGKAECQLVSVFHAHVKWTLYKNWTRICYILSRTYWVAEKTIHNAVITSHKRVIWKLSCLHAKLTTVYEGLRAWRILSSLIASTFCDISLQHKHTTKCGLSTLDIVRCGATCWTNMTFFVYSRNCPHSPAYSRWIVIELLQAHANTQAYLCYLTPSLLTWVQKKNAHLVQISSFPELWNRLQAAWISTTLPLTDLCRSEDF